MTFIAWAIGLYLTFILCVAAFAIVTSLAWGVMIEIAHKPIFYGTIAVFLAIVIWSST
jgi:hypothetical protein